jgi:hypothetical protein
MRKKLAAVVAVVVMVLGFGIGTASADPDKAAPVTRATEIHGLPGNNPGYGGSSASPNGNGAGGGNGIHNIAGGAPGQNGGHADDRPPACTMHGGLGNANVNQNC